MIILMKIQFEYIILRSYIVVFSINVFVTIMFMEKKKQKKTNKN